MPSRRWRALDREVEELRRHFLPVSFNALGEYPEPTRVQANTRAFVVLSHAEIEWYLEDWAKDVAKASEAIWVNKSRFTPPLVYLLASLSERLSVGTSSDRDGGKDIRDKLSGASTKLFQKYYKLIKDNNGVREKNFRALFLPLGLPLSVVGSTLLPNLDSFGQIRGMHAHQAAKAVVSPLDPETEYDRVRGLINDLRTFDAWLSRYRRQLR